MPYIRQWVAPDVFHIVTIDEDGVRNEPSADSVDVYIYYAYKGDSPLSCWYCTDPGEYEGDIGPWDFDIRSLARGLGYSAPSSQTIDRDLARTYIEKAVLRVLEGRNWSDGQSFKCIAHAVRVAGESASNAVPTRS
jgi:hypothetical protein